MDRYGKPFGLLLGLMEIRGRVWIAADINDNNLIVFSFKFQLIVFTIN